jgi:aryl-alcohol dehydrogenase-like predicted oxidoreductase
MKMHRRQFIKSSALAVGTGLLSSEVVEAMSSRSGREKLKDRMPKRIVGRTGQKISIIGFGGIVVKNAEPEHARKVVAEAVEKGINYFDVAPSYGDSEMKLGPALQPFRKNCFLACKTQRRDKAGAKEELDNSLKNLKTDYFDLYQLHAISDVEKDVKAALSKDGAIQTFIEARKAGVIRYLGFSAHSDEAALTAMKEFDFDTILYPINFCTHYKGKFDQKVVAEAKKRKMGILALKAMALQRLQNKERKKQYPKCWYEPIAEQELARKALAWTLEQGVSAMVPPGEEKLFRIAMNLGPQLVKIDKNYDNELESLSAKLNPLFRA